MKVFGENLPLSMMMLSFILIVIGQVICVPPKIFYWEYSNPVVSSPVHGKLFYIYLNCEIILLIAQIAPKIAGQKKTTVNQILYIKLCMAFCRFFLYRSGVGNLFCLESHFYHFFFFYLRRATKRRLQEKVWIFN